MATFFSGWWDSLTRDRRSSVLVFAKIICVYVHVRVGHAIIHPFAPWFFLESQFLDEVPPKINDAPLYYCRTWHASPLYKTKAPYGIPGTRYLCCGRKCNVRSDIHMNTKWSLHFRPGWYLVFGYVVPSYIEYQYEPMPALYIDSVWPLYIPRCVLVKHVPVCNCLCFGHCFCLPNEFLRWASL